MALTAEQLTVVRSSLDPSGFVQGMQTMQQASKDAADFNRRRQRSRGAEHCQGHPRRRRLRVQLRARQAKLDPAYASATAYAKTQDTITRAVQNGRATQDDANRLLDLAAAKYATGGKAVEGFGGSTRATTMLVREATRSFAEMAAGVSPLEVALLNIGHVEHAFESFGGVVKQAWGFLTSGPAIVLEVVAALGTMAYVAETDQRALNGLSNRLALTRDNFATLAPAVREAARELAASSSLTTPQASVMLTTVYSAPIFQGTADQASDIARTFSDLNLMLGDSAGDAKHLAEALADPAKLLQELADRHVVGFTQALVNNAKELEAGGKTAEAMTLLLAQLNVTTKVANDNLTPMQKAMHDLDLAFAKATGSSDGLATTIGPTEQRRWRRDRGRGHLHRLDRQEIWAARGESRQDIQQLGFPLPGGRSDRPGNEGDAIPRARARANALDPEYCAAWRSPRFNTPRRAERRMSPDARSNTAPMHAGGVSYSVRSSMRCTALFDCHARLSSRAPAARRRAGLFRLSLLGK